MSRFCEAILNYVANIDRAPDKTITTSRFSQQIFSALEVLFSVWLNSKEAKLRLAVVECLGFMTHILTQEKLQELLPKLVPGMLGLYKKFSTEVLPITQGLQMMLDAAVRDGNQMLFPQLELILTSLYPLLQYLPNFEDPPSVKNYNEVLRCFEKLCQPFSDRVVNFLFVKLENKEERSRVGAIGVLKHLVNSCGTFLNDKQGLVVSGVRPLLLDPSTKVRQALAQLIIAMAHHNYLSLEGGQSLVAFIVQQCSISSTSAAPAAKSKKDEDPTAVTPLQLRSMCDNILHLMTTTVPHMDSVLWPYLLEFIVPAEFTEALPVVCMCISNLAQKLVNEESELYDLDYDVQVNLPKPHDIIARLVVVLGQPLERCRGLHILNTLLHIVPNLHENLVDLWEEVIPKLLAYFQKQTGVSVGSSLMSITSTVSNVNSGEEWKQSTWEDLVLKLLSRSLDAVDREDWTLSIGASLGKQFSLYIGVPALRSMLSKCIGVVLRKATKREFILEHLTLLFQQVDHGSQTERDGVAKAFGFTASSHLDIVIEKLGELASQEMVRKSTGFLGLMKDKTEMDIVRIKSTIMLSYGYVTLYAPPNLITSRIELNILASINPHFANVRDTVARENLIRCVDLIGQALHPSHLKTDTPFVLNRRGDLLQHLMAYMRQESPTVLSTEIRSLAIDACTTLLLLDPKLSDADLFDLVQTAFGCIFDLNDVTDANKDLMAKTLNSLHTMLSVIIKKDCNAVCVQNLVKHLSRWMVANKDYQRAWMLQTYVKILESFETCIQQQNNGQGSSGNTASTSGGAAANSSADPASLDGLGKFLADLVPRCVDPSLSVRKDALGCIQRLLRIQEWMQGNGGKEDIMIDAITKLQSRSESKESNVQFSMVNDLAKVLAKKVSSSELVQFVVPLLDSLLDREADSASGACVVLNGMFRFRGEELGGEVDTLIDIIRTKLAAITHERTSTGVLRAVRTLSSHHLTPVVKKLMSFDLPYDEQVVNMWHSLCGEESLAKPILEQMLDILNTGRPYEERDGAKGASPSRKFATMPPRKATCALRELMVVEETEKLVESNYAAILAALLTRIGSAADIVQEKNETGPTAIADAIQAFKEFILRSKSGFLSVALEEAEEWSALESQETYTAPFTTISAALCKNKPDQLPRFVEIFDEVLKRVYDSQRIVAAAVFAEFINQQCGGDLSHITKLKNGLLTKLVDPCHVVRMLCIRGLGNLASVPDDQMKKHSTTALSAMMAGMDDRDDPKDDITLEAMKGLSKILAKVEEDNIRAILINISLRIRPCFEKDKAPVRAAAIRLFGDLSKFGDGPSKAPFLEQVHANMVSLLLHLNEADADVRKACKAALKMLGSLLGSEKVNAMFQQHLREDASLLYADFMNDLCKLLIDDFPEKMNFYSMNSVGFFKSEWWEIKANAAIFIGFLLGNLPVEKRRIITKEHICGGEIALCFSSFSLPLSLYIYI